ncbi:uncharacterized protein BDV14DRAFT_170485 [Aspergillus stella-maris]|uniref:uncharacterized protein n=1 Tax=Aspergillus stella-maris TaxID=1810926 RepID=UPI003CCCB7DD
MMPTPATVCIRDMLISSMPHHCRAQFVAGLLLREDQEYMVCVMFNALKPPVVKVNIIANIHFIEGGIKYYQITSLGGRECKSVIIRRRTALR